MYSDLDSLQSYLKKEIKMQIEYSIKNYLDNNGSDVISNLDLEEKKIEYNPFIKGADIHKITGEEELVRAYLLTRLINDLGYDPEKIELETKYSIGRPKPSSARVDVILRDNNGDAFLFIETKNRKDYEKDKDAALENQLFNLAAQEEATGKKVKYLVLFTFELSRDSIKDNCMIIDYEKEKVFSNWEEKREFTDKLPSHYGNPVKEAFRKGGNKDLETDFTHDQLDGLRENLHDVLWGGGGTDDNDIFSSLVNIILAKIQDESEKKNGENYDFQIYTYSNGESSESEQEIFDRINKLYRRALKQRLNRHDETKLKKAFVIDENKFSLKKLRYTISQLERYSFVDGKNSLNGKDILGDFFEGIIKDGFKQSKGQFFTPINIVNFMLWGVNLDSLVVNLINKESRLPYVIDPSAGSGTFLIEAMKFITNIAKYKKKHELNETRDLEDNFDNWFIPDHRENKWAKDFIYGTEINFNLGTATKVNMILHGDGSSNIFVDDGLLKFSEYKKDGAMSYLESSTTDVHYDNLEVNSQFDVILSNPPFSVTLDPETKKNLKQRFIYGGKATSQNLFIERYYQLLRENGRMAIVLPDNIFDTTSNKYIRLFLYKYFKIKAIVSLPSLTFEPHTSTKTSILFAQKKTQSELNQWENSWSYYSNLWRELELKVRNISEVLKGNKEKGKLPSIKNLTDREEKDLVIEFLANKIHEDDYSLDTLEIIEKYKFEIEEYCKKEKDDYEDFNHLNTTWVFERVSEKFDYQILMAEAENVGYKRTKVSNTIKPNDLYMVDASGEIEVESTESNKILNELRKVEWD